MKSTDLTDCIRLTYGRGLRAGEWVVRVAIRPAPWAEFCAVQNVSVGTNANAVLKVYENMGGR